MFFVVAVENQSSSVALWVILVPAVVTLGGTVATFWAARYSARRAGETDSIKLGVTELVDQLREERAHFQTEADKCHTECAALRSEVDELRDRVGSMMATIDDRDAEIIRLKLKAGEPLG